MTRRLLAIPALAALVLLALAGPASAHVEVDPTEAMAGTTTTLTFTFHHGKDGTATTGLEVLIPDGVVVEETPEVPGWTVTVDDEAGTVTWSGGSIPDGEHGAFPIVVTLPAEAGELLFKTVQTTEAGELAWIQEEADGHGEEGDHPAPRLVLTANPDVTATTESPTTTESDDDATTTTERRGVGTTVEADSRDDGSNNAAAWFIGSGIAAIVAIAVGGYVLKRRAG